jgi:tetratricopeptide (TPR) repeat protein
MRQILLKSALYFGTLLAFLSFQTPPSNPSDIQRLNQTANTLLTDKKLSEAETVALEALSKAQAKNDPLSQAMALETLGVVAQMRFDYNNAMGFFVQSLKIRESLGDRRGMATCKNRIGKVFLLQDNESQAKANFESALTFLSP